MASDASCRASPRVGLYADWLRPISTTTECIREDGTAMVRIVATVAEYETVIFAASASAAATLKFSLNQFWSAASQPRSRVAAC